MSVKPRQDRTESHRRQLASAMELKTSCQRVESAARGDLVSFRQKPATNRVRPSRGTEKTTWRMMDEAQGLEEGTVERGQAETEEPASQQPSRFTL